MKKELLKYGIVVLVTITCTFLITRTFIPKSSNATNIVEKINEDLRLEITNNKEVIISLRDSINIDKSNYNKQLVISEYWYAKYFRNNKKSKKLIYDKENYDVNLIDTTKYNSVISRYRFNKKRNNRINRSR